MENQTLNPVGGPVSREKLAYDAIKEAILTFRLKPGQSLVENELASQLGTSKTPVRDALLRLEKEGLVVKMLYKGTYVADINRQTMVDMFQIRAVLEGLAAALATPNILPEDIQEGLSLVEQHKMALNHHDIRRASILNRQFHDLILRRVNNPWLLQILSNLDDHLKRYRILSNFQRGRSDKSAREHERILNAFIAKDAVEAETAMRQHLTSVLIDLNAQGFEELVDIATHGEEK